MIDSPSPRRVRDPVRTRAAIIESLLTLLAEGEGVTARRLAERAGVSERSVFVHFDDLDDLRAAAALAQHDRIIACLTPIDPDLPVAQRVSQLVEQREAIYPLQALRLAALAEARRSALVSAQMTATEKILLGQVDTVLGHELLGASGRVDADRRAAVDATVGWGFRHHLCHDRGQTPLDASRVVRTAVFRLLGIAAPVLQ